jgi:SSS family solute:Na+ symporter
MPLIVVIPGIAIYLLHSKGYQFTSNGSDIMQSLNEQTGKMVVRPDKAYSAVLSLLPSGFVGLVFAALTAAVVASLAGKANSIATIFALDIYKKAINKEATETQLVNIGRITIIAAMLVAVIIAPVLKSFGQIFQFIQDFTGLISPGVLAIFIMGFFWRGNTANAALLAAIITIPLGLVIETLVPDMPFMNRMGWVFVALIAIQYVISMLDNKRNEQKGLDIKTADFQVSTGFAVGAILVSAFIAALYILFW